MAYTEFYTNFSTGSNLNGGSDESGAAKYTSTNGNWNGSSTFTPADVQAASLIAVGDFASVYNDGASVGVYVARVVTINQSGGNITSIVLSTTAKAGTVPTSSATGRSVKVGGTWKGPNAASGFPFTMTTLGAATNSSADRVCINLKNNTQYDITAVIASPTSTAAYSVFGYSSTVRDGGKATIDGSTAGASYSLINISGTSATGNVYGDIIFNHNGATGSAAGVSYNTSGSPVLIRCVFANMRGNGFLASVAATATLIECEAYGNNLSNTATLGGFAVTGAANYLFINCYSHDNTGSNTAGFQSTGNTCAFINCISDTNGGPGFRFTTGSNVTMLNCDTYANGSDGVVFPSATNVTAHLTNCNFIKNGGWGINGPNNTGTAGFIYNCGFGAGTQVNTSGTITTPGNISEVNSITYASNVTPWVAPTTGNFTVNLAAANFAGRSAFTETDGTNTGTAGHPDIGAAQSLTGPGGTFSKEVSYGSAY